MEQRKKYIILSSIVFEFPNSLPTGAFAAKRNKAKIVFFFFYSEDVTVHFTWLQSFH